jgi:hypothetical protein
MKTIFLLFIVTLITTTTNAQKQMLLETAVFESSTNHAAKANLDPRIIRKFHAEFPGVTNDKWIAANDGFSVRFTAHDIQNWVFLNKKGKILSQMRYYEVKNLPADVRNQLKSVYYDYTIKGIIEIVCNNTKAYLVTVENESTWKVIRVLDRDMEVFEEYQKN